MAVVFAATIYLLTIDKLRELNIRITSAPLKYSLQLSMRDCYTGYQVTP